MIRIIAAISLDRAIGYYPNKNKAGQLPWDKNMSVGDLHYFKNLTSGNVVIMGRKTYNSIPGGLPERHNIVVTHNIPSHSIGSQLSWATSIEEAIKIAKIREPGKDIFIIGGSEIFSQAMIFANEIILTIIPMKAYEQFEIDKLVYFPNIAKGFTRISASQHPYNPELRIIKYRS